MSIGQVNKVVKELLSNDAACPEQIVAVIDMRDASVFSIIRRVSLLNDLGATLCKVTRSCVTSQSCDISCQTDIKQ